MPFKKSGGRTTQAGDFAGQELLYISWVRRKLWSSWGVLSISAVASLICIQMNTTDCLPNGLGTREKDTVLPSPPPPSHTEWFWEQVRGKGHLVLFSGSSQQWSRYSPWGHHNWFFPTAFNYSPQVVYVPLVPLLGLTLIRIPAPLWIRALSMCTFPCLWHFKVTKNEACS